MSLLSKSGSNVFGMTPATTYGAPFTRSGWPTIDETE